MSTIDTAAKTKLAINGGPKAFAKMQGKKEPKIGPDEFMSIAERFGLSSATLEKIRVAIGDEDWGAGPTLSRYLTAKPAATKGETLEQLARKTFGARFAFATSSGTGALHAAFAAAGVGPGTEVIVPAIGFYATAAAVVASRGVPIFCDVDDSLCMNAERIESLITPRTVAIAPTCVMGAVPDLDPILRIARQHDLKVIEDCAQAPGAKYKGRCVGTFGDLGCFSISAYKIVGGGEGGLLLCSDEHLFERACQLRNAAGSPGPIASRRLAIRANCSAARTIECRNWKRPSTWFNYARCPNSSTATMPSARVFWPGCKPTRRSFHNGSTIPTEGWGT